MQWKNGFLILWIYLLGAMQAMAQMGIGTENPNSSAQLDIVASNRGILIPRVNLSNALDESTISSGNTESLLVYNLTQSSNLNVGFYFWHNQKWRHLLSSDNLPDNLVLYHPVDNTFHYIDQDGNTHQVALSPEGETLTNLKLYSDGKTLAYQDENGDLTLIDLKNVVQTNQKNTVVEPGMHTTIEGTTTNNTISYKVNVDTAKGHTSVLPSTLGVVKERVSRPEILISPEGELSINKSTVNTVKTIQQNYTALASDRIILAQTPHTDITITLPNPQNQEGKKYTIKKESSSEEYYLYVSGNIAGLNGQTLYTAIPYSGWDLVSDGQQWIILNKI